MAKKTKEQVIADLEIKQISYSEDMSYDVLCELNKEPEKVEEELKVEEVTLGVNTINDHEYRLAVIEKKLGIKWKK
jgi:hypothetical protein